MSPLRQALQRAFRPRRSLRADVRRLTPMTFAVLAASATTAAAAPSAPTGLTVNATGPKQVALSWKAPAQPVSYYLVYRNGVQIDSTTRFAPFYLDEDAALTNGTSYTYTVTAVDGSGASAPSASASGAPAQATPITSCAVRGSGHYILTQAIPSPGADCLKFKDGANISLTCAPNITLTANTANQLIVFENVTGHLVTHCKFALTQKAEFGTVNQGSRGFWQDNTFSTPTSPSFDGAMHFNNTKELVANDNKFFRAAAGLDHLDDSAFVGNTLTEQSGANGIAVWSVASNRTSISNNIIDGGGLTGNDDGIVLQGISDGMIASGNVIKNYSDAGIEPVGSLSNSWIEDNDISHTANTAIGEWHNTDFRGNHVNRNQMSDIAGKALDFSIGDYRPAWGSAVIKVGTVAQFNMANNEFIGNKVTPKAGSTGTTVLWKPDPTTDTTTGKRISWSNNTFADNYFGSTVNGPQITDTTSIKTAASTGNVCQPNYVSGTQTTPVAISCGAATRAEMNGSLLVVSVSTASRTVNMYKTTTFEINASNGVDPGTGCSTISPFIASCPLASAQSTWTYGSGGNDTINVSSIGIPSTVWGNGGNDSINTKNGVADTVKCGTGTDTARTDTTDTTNADCETVTH